MDTSIAKPRIAAGRKMRSKRPSTQALTKRKLAGSEGQRLAAIVAASDDAIIGQTADGVVTSWNDGANRIFGYTAEEMIGDQIARIVPFDLIEEERVRAAKLAGGESIERFDTVRLARDGSRIPVFLTVCPLQDSAGKVVGATSVARDLSERNRLRRSEDDLQQARLDTENANRTKMEFLAVMSHEIRTPLNSISGFIDLLRHSSGLTSQQRRYADLVHTANALLLTIVNDLLDFSKIEAGRLELEPCPFSLSSSIEDMVAIVLPTATTKNLLLRCTIARDAPDWITGDQARLRQILLNLISNAIKFTDRGSVTVEVRPQIAMDGRERIFFSIADTGIGIAPEHQHRLFEKFSQADSSMSRKYGGAGLGLAICKRMVELMEGEIGIVSGGPGLGSTAWFTAVLPRVPKQMPEPEIESMLGDPDGRAFRILVVDDMDTNLEIAEAYLQDCGYQVDCVSNGFEAIRLLGNIPYDLVLMDIQMPEMDGVTATKRIRALPAPIRDIPIIAMTGNVLPQQVRAFLEAGMNDHVGKPIERIKLFNNIRRWLPAAGGNKVRSTLNSPNFDRVQFDEFLVVVGREKAERIANKFLVHLDGAFKSTWEHSMREAHALINTAGVLGLGSFVEACRRAKDFALATDSERGRAEIEALQLAVSTARQTFLIQLLPRLNGERTRSAA